jgi:hypothetical protein
MVKKLLLSISFFLSVAIFIAVGLKPDSSNFSKNDSAPPIPMPRVENDPFAHLAQVGMPIEQRESAFRKWLSASVKIRVTNASGSGTMVFYDSKENWVYVQSCGHLWRGSMSASEGVRRKITCTVIVWYHNETKLDRPREYSAEVLYYSNPDPDDISLLRFRPDWIPSYFPIGPSNFTYSNNLRLHSCGCDGGQEVAHYDVRLIGTRGTDVVTTENSPRRGRSGGGLMTEEFFIGICSRSSDPDGRIGKGNGYFTGLGSIRKMNELNGYGWLNDVEPNWARKIPIVNKNGPQEKFPADYIPIPEKK